MEIVAFGYKCQECGQGRVLERVFPEYHTKLKGYPVTVENARVGVCDRCGAEHFDAKETTRWRTLVEAKQAESYLQPAEIRDLRKQLGLSMEQFATLIGCTRQSLYNWERLGRPSQQSRMADLFMRLIRQSQVLGQIDILSFLTGEAAKLGLQLTPATHPAVPIVLQTLKKPLKSLASTGPEPLKLAADTASQDEVVVLVFERDQQVAKLSYDYQSATLNVGFVRSVPFEEFDVEIRFKDGTSTASKNVKIKDLEATLLYKTKRTEDDVDQVVLSPH